jgi:hypothetical protein
MQSAIRARNVRPADLQEEGGDTLFVPDSRRSRRLPGAIRAERA